jgi:hypothetical protein
VFLRDGDNVNLTYSTTARGVDRPLFSHNVLDLTPLRSTGGLGRLTPRVAAASHLRVGLRRHSGVSSFVPIALVASAFGEQFASAW